MHTTIQIKKKILLITQTTTQIQNILLAKIFKTTHLTMIQPNPKAF